MHKTRVGTVARVTLRSTTGAREPTTLTAPVPTVVAAAATSPTALCPGADGGGCGCGGDAFFGRQRTRLVGSRGARGPVVSCGGGGGGGNVGGDEGGGGYWWLGLP